MHVKHLQAYSEKTLDAIKIKFPKNERLHRAIAEMSFTIEQMKRKVTKEKPKTPKPMKFKTPSIATKKMESFDTTGRVLRSQAREQKTDAKSVRIQQKETKIELVLENATNNESRVLRSSSKYPKKTFPGNGRLLRSADHCPTK